MDLTRGILLATLLFALIISVKSLPIQEEDGIDINDFLFPATLPKYDVQTLNDDFDDHPMVADITSTIENSLQVTDKPEIVSIVSDDQNEIIVAMAELATLANLLEVNTKYIELRKTEDPSWPSTLPSKVSSQIASQEELDLFEADLRHALSGVVIMKMMEERLSLINKHIENILTTNPDANLREIFGENDTVEVAQALFSLKYLEGYLHAANIMIEEAANEVGQGKESSPSSFFDFDSYNNTDDPNLTDDDVVLTIGACLVLFFTLVGILFLAFTFVYLFFRMIKKCFEVGTVLEKKSKYEQI